MLRIDDILGLDLYGSTFGTSPLVFGAFPSLHSGCATLEMLFVAYLFPRLKPVAAIYVMWMWFATMYLTHHYMIDLVGGSIYAILAFVVAQNFLPKTNSDYRNRLAYMSVTKSSIRTFIYSIEHDICSDYNSIQSSNHDDEESAMKLVIKQHRPEPLRLSNMNEKRMESAEPSPALSPSSGYWSSTSEPASPITPHSSLGSPQMHFSKA